MSNGTKSTSFVLRGNNFEDRFIAAPFFQMSVALRRLRMPDGDILQDICHSILAGRPLEVLVKVIGQINIPTKPFRSSLRYLVSTRQLITTDCHVPTRNPKKCMPDPPLFAGGAKHRHQNRLQCAVGIADS